MIIGIGNDIESISRVSKSVETNARFLEMILTQQERRQLSKRKGKHYNEFVAGRFSAKEALSKATGCGIGNDVGWHDIEILNDDQGRPIMNVEKIPHPYKIHVTITHSGDFVNTVVIIEKLTFLERVKLKNFFNRRLYK